VGCIAITALPVTGAAKEILPCRYGVFYDNDPFHPCWFNNPMIPRLALIALLALFAFATAALGAGSYQLTKDGTAYVWNNYPRPGDEASWSGAKRRLVRESVLNSWAIDDAFDECSELVGSESNSCQAASLILNGIWLAAFAQMAVCLVASVFLAFLILVMADLTQTLLDTATNTGVMAGATGRQQT
jgi:hypothetical protein